MVGVHSEYIQIGFSFGYLLSVVKGICFLLPFLVGGRAVFYKLCGEQLRGLFLFFFRVLDLVGSFDTSTS